MHATASPAGAAPHQEVPATNHTLLIIPAYNEASRVGDVVRDARARLPDVDILVVDDGSLDATAAVASQAGACVATLPINLGYGGALQTGYKYALQQGYKYVLQMDADGQHSPASLPPLLAAVQTGGWDVALGSRFLSGTPYHAPLLRRAGAYILAAIVSALTGSRVTDPTSGFQALNSRALRFYATPAYPVDYPDADVLIMLHFAGLRFTEVPVVMTVGDPKKSMHSGLRPIYYTFKMMLSILMVILRGKRKFA